MNAASVNAASMTAASVTAAAGAPGDLPVPIRILADDLTGALDTAAMFAGHGPVPVRLDHPDACDPAPVTVVSTGTRDVPMRALAYALSPSLSWLSAAGLAFKKVDSLLRGNTLAEVAQVLRTGRFERVLFAPAFPAQGRTLADGRLHLGAPGSAAAARPAPAPGRLDAAFAALGFDAAVGDAALDALSGGGGPAVLIPDVDTDAALERLVALALAHPGRLLWCGSAGLAQALAKRGVPVGGGAASDHGTAPGREADRDPPAMQVAPRADAPRPLLVTATRHPVLRGQLARLHADRMLAAACTIADLADAEPLEPATAAARLAAGAARVVAEHPRPASVVVVGGDTLLALCRAAGVARLAAAPAPRPGWGAATPQDGAWAGVRCLTRSGAFGTPDDLVALLRATAPPPSTESR
jgi:uncharacterized protein YgbK (DUF1537 family)